MIKIDTRILHCKEKGCNHSFPWTPGRSSIPPKRCPECQRTANLNKAKEYSERRMKNIKKKAMIARQLAGDKTKQNIRRNYPLNISAFKVKEGGQQLVKRTKLNWYEKPTAELIQYVQLNIVNPYIRKRDRTCYGTCISCTEEEAEEAGHLYSVGAYPEMRFLICNIHGQGHDCNAWKGGNIEEYRKGIISRHGQKYLYEIEKLKVEYEVGNKLLRDDIIEIAKTYKHLSKHEIWVFLQAEFEQYRKSVNAVK